MTPHISAGVAKEVRVAGNIIGAVQRIVAATSKIQHIAASVAAESVVVVMANIFTTQNVVATQSVARHVATGITVKVVVVFTVSRRQYVITAARVVGHAATGVTVKRSEEHTSELQSRRDLVCRLLLEKK